MVQGREAATKGFAKVKKKDCCLNNYIVLNIYTSQRQFSLEW